jgi:hypothetical protein
MFCQDDIPYLRKHFYMYDKKCWIIHNLTYLSKKLRAIL